MPSRCSLDGVDDLLIRPVSPPVVAVVSDRVADWLAENDNITFSHRSAWSSRCGDLVRDGYMEKAGTVPGERQRVTAYKLTTAGWAWAKGLTSERGAA